jgi:predicted kinase
MSVIVDAAFLSKDDRTPFLEAARLAGAQSLIVACEANRDVLVERILSRRTAGNDPSEAGVDVLDAQVAAVEPLDPEERAESLSINTSDRRAVEKLLESIETRLGDPHHRRRGLAVSLLR